MILPIFAKYLHVNCPFFIAKQTPEFLAKLLICSTPICFSPSVKTC